MIPNLSLSKDIVLVSYYTDTMYAQYAARLAESAEYHGISYDIAPVPDRGSWLENNLFKPGFLLMAAKTYKDRTILWVDADAIVKADPIECRGTDFDVAAYFASPGKPWAGTVAFQQTEKAYAALNRWVDFCAENRPAMDQDVLGAALCKSTAGRVKHLPPAYCWVERQHRRCHGGVTPVIEHFMVGH
jgi:hypothetical protein